MKELGGNRWSFKTQVGLETPFDLQRGGGGGLPSAIECTIGRVDFPPYSLLEPW